MTVFLIQRQQIAAAIESVEGVAETLSAGDVIAPVFDVEWSPTFAMGERAAQRTSFSRIPQVLGERSAEIKFSTELKGSGSAGTAPPNLSALLQACGFSETIVPATSVTYAPITESIPSITLEVREGANDANAKIKRLVGARGTVEFAAVKGQPVMCNFTFRGRYVEPLDGAFLTAASPSPLPVPFLNAAFSFQSIGTLRVQNATIDVGNEVTMRNDANEATGNFSAIITNRMMSGSIDPEQMLTATADFFDRLSGSDEGIFTYALTGSAGNITTVTAPKVQIINISEGDRDGIRIEELSLSFNGNAAAGNDELSIAFT